MRNAAPRAEKASRLADSGFFAVRTPLLPFEELEAFGEGLEAAGAVGDPAALEELERHGYDVTRWRKRNLFFGGVSAVEVGEDGTLAAAGDPRRGGAGIVVE